MPFLFKVNNIPPEPPLTFNDDFTGNNGDPPDTNRWEVIATGGVNGYQIYNNRLRFNVSSGGYIGLGNKHHFTGDFDIQIDWYRITGPNTNNWAGYLGAEILDGAEAGWKVLMSRLYSVSQAIRYAKFSPGQVYSQFTTTAASGKFRITRIDGFLQGYHDIGAGWVSTYPTRFFTSNGTVKIEVGLTSGESNPTAVFDFDNLIDNLA